MAEGIEVRGAWLDNGLLHVDLARPQPEARVKQIRITRPGANGAEPPAAQIMDGNPETPEGE